MPPYESVRESRSRSREHGERRPRADRIAVDVSWSDHADFSWSEPRTRHSADPPVRPRRPAAEPDRAPGRAPEEPAEPPAEEPIALDAPPSEPASPTVVHAEPVSPAIPLAETDPAPEPTRRTVVIKGHGHGHYTPPRGGYEARLRPHERSGFKPDRVALWAVLLGLALLLGAVTSSHAAALHPALLHHLFQHAGTP